MGIQNLAVIGVELIDREARAFTVCENVSVAAKELEAA